MNLNERIRVLVVEDDSLVVKMIQRILDQIGYTFAGEASNGRQAVDLTQKLKPDVILMDVEMPDMGGLEATLQIQKVRPTPVVVLTAYDTPELVAQASVVGVGAYLLKPPKARDVERTVTVAMARFGDMMTMRDLNAELKTRNKELETALAKVKQLSGLLPICANCKKIRDDEGYWQQVEHYIIQHSEVQFTHGICPDCAVKLYSDFVE